MMRIFHGTTFNLTQNERYKVKYFHIFDGNSLFLFDGELKMQNNVDSLMLF